MRKRKIQSGFTLLEVLLYLSVSIIVVFAGMQLYILVLETRVKTATVTAVEEQGYAIVDEIREEIFSADSINTISLDGDATLSYVKDGIPVSIGMTGSELVKTADGVEVPLHNNHVSISDFIVRNLTASESSDSIVISFHLSYASPTSRNEYSYEQDFSRTITTRK
jgi:hypothetical protein